MLEEAEFDLGRELEGLVDMFSVQCINHNVETVLDLSGMSTSYNRFKLRADLGLLLALEISLNRFLKTSKLLLLSFKVDSILKKLGTVLPNRVKCLKNPK